MRCDVSININVENCHVNSFNSVHELVKSVDESLDNHADIILNDFLMKESVILLYHRRKSSSLLIHNNFAEKK